MKYLISIFLVCLSFISITSHSFANFDEEKIIDFIQTMYINKDGTIDISEKITYDFGDTPRHGIFRFIPYIRINKDAKKYEMTISNVSVLDGNNRALNFTQSQESGNLNIIIGDPDSAITGVHQYTISYKISGAITYFSDHDELYWNITGNKWQVPILRAQARVFLPIQMQKNDIKATCFQGKEGSKNLCENITTDRDIILSAQNLEPYEGMTVVIGFPKGHVDILEPKLVTDFFETLIGKLVLFGIMIMAWAWYFVYPIWLPIKWFLHGRDMQNSKDVVLRAGYDIPKVNGRVLTPAEIGTMIDERAQTREIVAMIIHLAQRGYLQIIEKKKNSFELVKKKDSTQKHDLLNFEHNFLTGIFRGADSIVIKTSDNIYGAVTSAIDEIYKHTVKNGLFPKNPEQIRKKYMIIAGIAVFTFNFPLAIMSSVFGQIMPKKTEEGVRVANLARSLRNFLISQERQLAFQADKKMLFEKLLPYAIAFGVEKVWANRFKDIKMQPTDWYRSANNSSFSTSLLAVSLGNSLNSSFNGAISQTTSSSGFSSGFSGGSSGGGGGGGGGGSW